MADVSPARAAGIARAINAGEHVWLPALGKALDDDVSLSAVRLLNECLYGLPGRCGEQILCGCASVPVRVTEKPSFQLH